MNIQKATYWFALALAAFALHSEYQRGAFPALHRAARCADASLGRLATNAERTVAMAKLTVEHPALGDGDLLASIDRGRLDAARQGAADQAEMASEEAQEQAEMVRERVRDEVRAQVEMIRGEARVRAQTRRIRVEMPQSDISSAIGEAMNRVVIAGPLQCAQPAVRVSVASIADSPDDDGDSN